MMLRTHLSQKEASCLCAVVAMVVYINTLDCGMVYDDEPAIKWNRDIRPDTPWKQLLMNDFWGTSLKNPASHKSYRPLCVATFRLNYMLHGLEPMGYHLVNVLLHAVVCYLYVQLCAVVFTKVWPALIAGLLFAVHPIHTEAVAGIVGRAELLSGVLFLLTFLVYRKALISTSQGGMKWTLVGLSIALGVCAMLSKEQGITSLAICLLYDFFIFNKLTLSHSTKSSSQLHSVEVSTKAKAFLVRGVIMSSAALVAIVIRLLVSNGAPSGKAFTVATNPPLSQHSPYRQMSWLHLVFVNMWLLLNPSRLSMDWRYGAVPLIESLFDWNNIYTLVTLILIVALVVYGLTQHQKSNRIVLFGVALMVIPFLPASNLFLSVGFVVAERVLYLPSMGHCLLTGYGTWILLTKTSKLFSAHLFVKLMIGYILVACSIKTASRNRDWYSATTLNRAGVRFNPKNGVLLSNLGIEHAMQEDYSQAELLYQASMRQSPSYSGGYYNYGMLMNLLHRYEEAEEPLLKAIQLGAKDALENSIADSFNLLITVISKNSSRLNEALQLSEQMLSQHPHYTLIYTTRCSIFMQLNRSKDMLRACEYAVQTNPGLSMSHYNLGTVYMKMGDLARAEIAFRNMLIVDRGSTLGVFHLAKVLQTTGQTSNLLEARQLLKIVVSQETANIEAFMSLADVEAMLHYYSQALDTLQNVLELDPDNKDALYKTGRLLYRKERYDEAVQALSKLNHLDPHYLDTTALLHKAQRRT